MDEKKHFFDGLKDLDEEEVGIVILFSFIGGLLLFGLGLWFYVHWLSATLALISLSISIPLAFKLVLWLNENFS